MATCEECKHFVPCTPESCWLYNGHCGHCHCRPPQNMLVREGKPGTYQPLWRCGYPHVDAHAQECDDAKPIAP